MERTTALVGVPRLERLREALPARVAGPAERQVPPAVHSQLRSRRVAGRKDDLCIETAELSELIRQTDRLAAAVRSEVPRRPTNSSADRSALAQGQQVTDDGVHHLRLPGAEDSNRADQRSGPSQAALGFARPAARGGASANGSCAVVLRQLDAQPLGHSVDVFEVRDDLIGVDDLTLGQPGIEQRPDVGLLDRGGTCRQSQGVAVQGARRGGSALRSAETTASCSSAPPGSRRSASLW